MESLSGKDKLDDKNCPNKASSVIEDLNNNTLKLQECCQTSSAHKANLDTQGSHDEKEKVLVDREKMDKLVVSKEKNCDQSSKSVERFSLVGSKNAEDAQQKEDGPDSKDGVKCISDRGRLKDNDGSSGAQDMKRKRPSDRKDDALSRETVDKEHSKRKKPKTKHAEKASRTEQPSLSFESYLNYDVNVLKRKVKPPKKTVEKEATKDSGMEAIRSKVASCVASEKQVSLTMTIIVIIHVSRHFSTHLVPLPAQIRESVMELMNLYSPGGPPEYENLITVSHSEKKGTKPQII